MSHSNKRLSTSNHNIPEFNYNSLANTASSNNKTLESKLQNYRIHSRAHSLPSLQSLQEESLPFNISSSKIGSQSKHRRTRSVVSHYTPIIITTNKSSFNKMSKNELMLEVENTEGSRRLRIDSGSDYARINAVQQFSRSTSPVLPLRCSTPSSFNKISSAPSSPTKRSSTTGRKSSTSSSTRSSIIDSATSPRSLDFWDQQLEGVELSWKRASEGSTIASTSNSLAVVEGSPRPRSQSLGEMKPSSSSTSKSIKPKLKAPAETLPNLGSIWESFLIEAEVSFEEADDLLSVPIPIPQALNSSISSSNRSISPFGLTSTTNVLDPFNQPTMFPIPTSSRNSLAERRDQSVSPLVISKTRSRTPSPTSISNTTRTKYESTPSTQPQLSDPISPSFPFLHHLSNTPNEFPSSSADNLNTYSPTTFTKLSLDSSYPPSSHSNSFNLRALTPSSGSSSSESSSSSNKSSPNHSPTNSLPSPLSPPPSAIFDSTPSSSTSSFSYSEFNFKGIYSPNSVSTIAEEEGYETDASSVHSVSRSEDRKSSNWGEEFERLGAGSRGSWFEPATSPPRPHSEASSNTDGSSYASLSGDGYGEEEDNDDTIRIAVVKQVSEIIESLKIQGQGVHFDLEVRDYKMERRIEEVEVGIIEWGVAL